MALKPIFITGVTNMGGLVSGVTDAIGDVVGGVGDAAGGVLKAAAPFGSLIGAATGVPYGALLGGLAGSALGGAGTTPQSQAAYGNLFQGSLGIGGQLAQNRVSREAAQAAQQQALAGGQTAANMAQFRPVGTTTRFGTSSYSIDPATGGLKADYSLSPLAAGYQQSLAGMTGQGLMQGQQLQNLASQYLGESPEAVRQRYVEQQTALLAPGQEQQLAGIRNRLFQTGRGGLATGATEAGGLAATNPEMAAYYNALANQQRQIAAGADQAAQQQVQFGQQLAGQAYNPFLAGFGAQGSVESAAQQPLTLAQEIAKLQAASGAQQGQLYGQGAQSAARIGLLPEMQTSNAATILGGLASPTSGLSGLFSGLGGGGFAGNPSGLGIGGIDYGNLSTIYSGGNPFEGILGAGETWYGE
jgi:hypothetical protein